MRRTLLLRKIVCVVVILYALSFAGCGGSSTTLKTLELTPKGTFQGKNFFGGQQGLCISGSVLSNVTFLSGPDQLMVGFDNLYNRGMLCDELRALTFRGLIDFDVSQFDSIVSANLIFETQTSIERIHATTGQHPPKSYANTLGLAFLPITRRLDYDTGAPLDPGPSHNVGVTSQVKSWLDGSHPNNGFVLAGPFDHPTLSDYRENNEAKMSWYGNFKLRIVYSPASNPRAPQ